MKQFTRAAMLVATFVAMPPLSPAHAAAIPPAAEDGWGHFVGCFSVLLDSVTHAQYCGPSTVPFNNDSLSKSDPSSAPPPPPPSCGPCTNGADLMDPQGEVLVAELSDHWLPSRRVRARWMLLACCPIGNS